MVGRCCRTAQTSRQNQRSEVLASVTAPDSVSRAAPADGENGLTGRSALPVYASKFFNCFNPIFIGSQPMINDISTNPMMLLTAQSVWP